MKKLIIALSVIAMAVCSEAATTNWKMHQGTSGILYDGYVQSAGGTYSKKALQTTVFCVAADLTSQSELVTAFQTGKNFKLTDYTTESTGKSTASTGKLTSANGLTFSRTDATLGDTYSYYEAVLVNYGGKDYLYVSDSSSATKALENEATASFTITPTGTSQTYKGTASYSGAGWYAVNVPEPTSGLLLLLGMAGLALRRRRA